MNHAHKIEDTGRFRRLADMAKENGLIVVHQPTVYIRSWPNASTRPYHVYNGNEFLAAYGTLASLEAGLQKRAVR